MNKVELIAKVAERVNEGEVLHINKKETTEVVGALIDVIVETLVAQEDVKLAGLGAFTIAEVAERAGRNPQTGEALTIDAHKKVKFKLASAVKEAVR